MNFKKEKETGRVVEEKDITVDQYSKEWIDLGELVECEEGDDFILVNNEGETVAFLSAEDYFEGKDYYAI